VDRSLSPIVTGTTYQGKAIGSDPATLAPDGRSSRGGTNPILTGLTCLAANIPHPAIKSL
jgi:hypothetical protein